MADWHIVRNDSAPEVDEEAYQFACDQVAAELESQAETTQVVATLSGARHVVQHLLSQKVPQHLLPHLRELSDLVRDVSGRVDQQMSSLSRPDLEDAA